MNVNVSEGLNLNFDICLTKSFQADRDPRERGPRPLNSHR